MNRREMIAAVGALSMAGISGVKPSHEDIHSSYACRGPDGRTRANHLWVQHLGGSKWLRLDVTFDHEEWNNCRLVRCTMTEVTCSHAPLIDHESIYRCYHDGPVEPVGEAFGWLANGKPFDRDKDDGFETYMEGVRRICARHNVD